MRHPRPCPSGHLLTQVRGPPTVLHPALVMMHGPNPSQGAGDGHPASYPASDDGSSDRAAEQLAAEEVAPAALSGPRGDAGSPPQPVAAPAPLPELEQVAGADAGQDSAVGSPTRAAAHWDERTAAVSGPCPGDEMQRGVGPLAACGVPLHSVFISTSQSPRCIIALWRHNGVPSPS